MNKQLKNRLQNLLSTAKKQDGRLIIRERDKYLAVRHTDTLLKQSGCSDILVKLTKSGTAYCKPSQPDIASFVKHDDFTEEVSYQKGTLQSIINDNLFISK